MGTCLKIGLFGRDGAALLRDRVIRGGVSVRACWHVRDFWSPLPEKMQQRVKRTVAKWDAGCIHYFTLQRTMVMMCECVRVFGNSLILDWSSYITGNATSKMVKALSWQSRNNNIQCKRILLPPEDLLGLSGTMWLDSLPSAPPLGK